MRMLRVRKKFFGAVGFLVALVAIAGFAVANIKSKTADAEDKSQATITSTTEFSYNGEDKSRVFNLSNGQHAYCAQHSKGDPSGTVKSSSGAITITGSSNANYQLYYKILYYGKTFTPSNSSSFSSVEVARNWAITYALNFAYPGGTKKEGGTWAPYTAGTELINYARKNSLPAGKNTLYIYDLNAKGEATSKQVILAAEHADIQYFSLSATKHWDDGDVPSYAYNARPDSITFTLTGSNGEKQTKTLNAPANKSSNDWGSVKFEKLTPGVKYTIAESVPTNAGYGILSQSNCSNLDSKSSNKSCVITNKLRFASFSKTWDDDNAQNRPKAYFCLVDESNNNAVQYSKGCIEYDQSNPNKRKLNYTWYGLVANHVYSVCELDAKSYTAKVATCKNNVNTTYQTLDGYNTKYKKVSSANNAFDLGSTEISNSKKVTSLVVSKYWSDDNDFANRPDYIYVCLTVESSNSKIIDPGHCVPLKVTKTGRLQAYTFENLALLDAGKRYSACEVSKSVYDALPNAEGPVYCDDSVSQLDGYTVTYERSDKFDQVAIRNTKTEKVYVNVEKVWTDEGHESERPSQISVVVQGYVNGVAVEGLTYNEIIAPADGQDKTASSTWKASFGPYEKEYNGEAVDYRIDEVNLGNSNYSKVITRLSSDEHNVNYEIRNATRYIPITKQWLEYRGKNSNDAPDYRPDHVTFTLFRKAYGDSSYTQQKVYTVYLNGQGTTEGATLKSASTQNWEIEIGPLAYYDDAGHEYEYKLEEQIELPYTLDPSYTGGNMTDGFKFGNATKMIEVAKVWDDQNNADGIRPNRVGINIIAKVNGVEKSEFSKVAEDGYFEITVDDVYSSHSNIWVKQFGPLPKFDLQGNEIVYEAVEVLPDGSQYVQIGDTAKVSVYLKDSFIFTNQYRAKTSIKIVKHWGIGDALPATLPEVIHFTLYRNGVVDPDYADVSMYVSDEIQMAVPEGTSPDDMWRYAHVWSKDITNLDKYDSRGQEIVWTVSEQGFSGYHGDVNCYAMSGAYSRICEVTNVRQDTVKLNVYKDWVDENDDPLAEEIARPRTVKFLIRRGITGVMPVETYSEKTVTVTKNEQGQWFGSVDELPRYDHAGREYEYDIWEIPAGPYSSTITPFSNQNIPNGRDMEGNYYFSAVNKLSDHTNIVVEKCWLDNDNSYKTRPAALDFDFITYLNGVVKSTETFSLTAADLDEETGCWVGGKTDLPTHDAENGRYTYEFVEKNFTMNANNEVGEGEAWYEAEGATSCNAEDEGYVCTFINRLVGKITKSGTKTWLDGGRADFRPDTLELTNIQTLEGRAAIEYNVQPTWTKNDDNTWTYTYTDLPLFNNSGVRYRYRIEEKYTENDAKNGDKYVSQQTAQAGDFKNLLTGKLNYCGKKVWVDSDAPEGFRPEQITVSIERNGVLFDTATVTSTTPEGYAQLCGEDIDESGDVWYFVFPNLDKYDDNGAQYSYTLDENTENLDQYITKVVDSTITNTYAPKKTTVYVEKIWLNDEKDDRPGYIDVTLYRNGQEYDKVRLTEDAAGKWYYEWPMLDANYEYTLKEDYQIPNYYEGWYEYTSQVDGTYVKIFNQKVEDTPDTGDRNILFYVISVFAVATGGLFVARRVMCRR